MQTGDKLGDKHTVEFARALAVQLRLVDWCNAREVHRMQHIVLSLSPNVQTVVLQELRDSVLKVLSEWPLPMKLVRPFAAV